MALDKKKMAHLIRAKQIHDDPNTNTPGSFTDYFKNQYVKEYGEESKKMKPDPNALQNKKYRQMLASTRDGDIDDSNQGLGGMVQVNKNAFPANPSEDEKLLEKIHTAIYSPQIRKNLIESLRTSKNQIGKIISTLAAHLAGRFVLEMRKKRPVSEKAEDVIIRIIIEELWVLARNLGEKNITMQMIQNTVGIAKSMFDQIEQGMQSRAATQPEQVQLNSGGLTGEQ